MGRPKKFDRDEALNAAKALFWKKGYDATTTDDLRHAMGIGRQSLYGSFGGKRPLYLEVLRRYNAESIIGQITRLRAAASPLAGIRDLLLAFANDTVERRKLGCMGIAAICTFGSDDTDVSAISHASGAVLKSTLEEVLAKAKRLGETRPSLDVRATAHFIQATVIGIKVSARGGANSKILRSIALTALEGLVPQ